MTGPRWPNGAWAACAFTFDLDAETFHPQIIGRPSRPACLQRLIGHARATRGVWIARLDEVAAGYRERG